MSRSGATVAQRRVQRAPSVAEQRPPGLLESAVGVDLDDTHPGPSMVDPLIDQVCTRDRLGGSSPVIARVLDPDPEVLARDGERAGDHQQPICRGERRTRGSLAVLVRAPRVRVAVGQ